MLVEEDEHPKDLSETHLKKTQLDLVYKQFFRMMLLLLLEALPNETHTAICCWDTSTRTGLKYKLTELQFEALVLQRDPKWFPFSLHKTPKVSFTTCLCKTL